MALVLGAGAYCDWTEAAELLRALEFNDEQARETWLSIKTQLKSEEAWSTQKSILIEESAHLSGVKEQLLLYPNRRVVLLYADLPFVLTVLLRESPQNIEQGLTIWVKSLQELQDFYRLNRKQVLLFSLRQVLENPDAFLKTCSHEWQHELPLNHQFKSKSISIDPAVDLFARQLVLQDPSLDQMLRYTEALTWPLDADNTVSVKSPSGVFEALKAYGVLLSQTEQSFLELKTIKRELTHKIQKLEKQRAALELSKGELKSENKLVLDQLLLVQEELEQRILAEKRVTQQLKKKKDVSKENSLLLKQLHRVQEQLEVKHLQEKKQAIEKRRKAQSVQKMQSIKVDDSPKKEIVNEESKGELVNQSFFARRAAKKALRLSRRKDRERAEQIAKSVWFNAAWYLEQYPDVAADPVQSANPALHYMRMGGFEGRNPSSHFDSAYYLSENPDVLEARINPLWHFLQNGQAEGRQPHP